MPCGWLADPAGMGCNGIMCCAHGACYEVLGISARSRPALFGPCCLAAVPCHDMETFSASALSESTGCGDTLGAESCRGCAAMVWCCGRYSPASGPTSCAACARRSAHARLPCHTAILPESCPAHENPGAALHVTCSPSCTPRRDGACGLDGSLRTRPMAHVVSQFNQGRTCARCLSRKRPQLARGMCS